MTLPAALCGVVPGTEEAVLLGCACPVPWGAGLYRLLARCPVHGAGVRIRHQEAMKEARRRRYGQEGDGDR